MSAVGRASFALVVTVWASSAIFGIYILVAYVGAFANRDLALWNTVLPGLYETSTPRATAAIGIHFVAGGVILVLGFIQLIDRIRHSYPVIHRALGRIYVMASLIAGLGGLGFILAKGTVGGRVMDAGFGLYGVLMVVCAVQTYRHARHRRIEVHRQWALRLFALAIGSWLYRMDYGFWFVLADGVGHTDTFSGPFDNLMAFAFYLPNLVVVEAVLHARPALASITSRRVALGALIGSSGFLIVGTSFFTARLWGPAILHQLSS